VTVTQNRGRAVELLHAHQPDDVRSTTKSLVCTCGERLPATSVVAIAVHQAFQLQLADLLRADPTGPLSMLSLSVLEPGEVVFDGDGIAWVKAGAAPLDETDPYRWITYDERVVPNLLTNEDLRAERGPLSLYREGSRGGEFDETGETDRP